MVLVMHFGTPNIMKHGFVTIHARVGQHLAMEDVPKEIGKLIVEDNVKLLIFKRYFCAMEGAKV